MTTKRTHEEHADSIGAYALGALPELEARVFERHLMGCEACQEELSRLDEAVDALPRSVEPYEAPASLKKSLMEAVRADAAPARRAFRLPRLPTFRPAFAAGLASLLLLAALAGYGVSTLRDDDGGGVETLAAQIDERRLPDASASLVLQGEDGPSVLRVEGLPEPGRGRIYQVWVQRGTKVVPVSIFDVDSRGRGAAAVPEPLDDASAVMVTREQRGGAPAPTEAPLLRVDV